MIWQLLQVHHLNQTPLILVGEMWPGLAEWAKTSMLSADVPLASAEDLAIPQCVANGDEALAIIKQNHTKWRRQNHTLAPAKSRKHRQPGSKS